MPEERLNMRMDSATARRMAALARKLELNYSTIVRQAIKQMAEREGVEKETGDQ